jgi:hypothetical protein
MISNFKQLLQIAREQDQPQRLLFLFAKAESSAPKKKQKKSKDQHGTITPVMCVDKLPDDLDTYQALIAEADQINKEWDFVLIAGLSGKNGIAPTTEEADPYLNQMTNHLASGQDLSQYVIFDREGSPVVIQAS